MKKAEDDYYGAMGSAILIRIGGGTRAQTVEAIIKHILSRLGGGTLTTIYILFNKISNICIIF
jgi:hypothetical protein